MSHTKKGLNFVLAVVAASEAAVIFYFLSVTNQSAADPGPSYVAWAAVAMPLTLIVFLYFTARGRKFLYELSR